MTAHLEHRRLGLEDLISQVLDGRIGLAHLPHPPDAARELVWPPEEVGALLESVQRHHPIESFLVWRTHEVLPVVERLSGRKLGLPITRSRSYLIDGRLRVASLISALTCSGASSQWYYDLAARAFVYSAKPTQSFLPLCILLNLEQLTAWLGTLQETSWVDRGYRLNQLFAHYPLVIAEMSNLDLPEVEMMLRKRHRTHRPV